MTVTPPAAGFSTDTTGARVLHVLDKAGYGAWLEAQPAATRTWLSAQQFDAAPGSHVLLPGEDGVAAAILGIGDPLDPYSYAHAAGALPEGDWTPAQAPAAEHAAALQLGWGLGAYRFTRYKDRGRAPARLALEAPDAEALDLLAACIRVRDLVNTPTQDMGPEQLEAVAREVATAHGATFESIVGDALLAENFPAIHAVGRASHRAPRLLKLQWGFDGDTGAHPHLVLVGKGACRRRA